MLQVARPAFETWQESDNQQQRDTAEAVLTSLAPVDLALAVWKELLSGSNQIDASIAQRSSAPCSPAILQQLSSGAWQCVAQILATSHEESLEGRMSCASAALRLLQNTAQLAAAAPAVWQAHHVSLLLEAVACTCALDARASTHAATAGQV